MTPRTLGDPEDANDIDPLHTSYERIAKSVGGWAVGGEKNQRFSAAFGCRVFDVLCEEFFTFDANRIFCSWTLRFFPIYFYFKSQYLIFRTNRFKSIYLSEKVI